MKQVSWQQDEERRRKWLAFMQNFYPEINPQTIRLMESLGFVTRAVYHVGEQSVEATDLSFAQYRVLMHLFFVEQMSDGAGLNPSEISDRQGVSRNTISALIRNLEEEGLIRRRLDPDDRRRFNINLTESGRALVQQHIRHHLVTIDGCFRVLEAEEQETLIRLLRKLRAHVTDVSGEGGCRQVQE